MYNTNTNAINAINTILIIIIIAIINTTPPGIAAAAAAAAFPRPHNATPIDTHQCSHGL